MTVHCSGLLVLTCKEIRVPLLLWIIVEWVGVWYNRGNTDQSNLLPIKSQLHLQFRGQCQLRWCIKNPFCPVNLGYSCMKEPSWHCGHNRLMKQLDVDQWGNSWFPFLLSWEEGREFLKGFKWVHFLEQTNSAWRGDKKGSSYSLVTAEHYKDKRKRSTEKEHLGQVSYQAKAELFFYLKL